MYGIIINKSTKSFIRDQVKQFGEFQSGEILIFNEKNEATNVVTDKQWAKMVDPGGNSYLYGSVTAHLTRRFGLAPQFESRVHYSSSTTGVTSGWIEGIAGQPEIEAIFNKHEPPCRVKLTYLDHSSIEYRRNF